MSFCLYTFALGNWALSLASFDDHQSFGSWGAAFLLPLFIGEYLLFGFKTGRPRDPDKTQCELP